MIRTTLIVALCVLPFCGCGQVDNLVADEATADGNKMEAVASDDDDVRTPLIRALLQTVDETKGESSEVKDSLKRTLREADRDLAKVLGGNSKRLILQANKKASSPIIGQTRKPAVKPKQSGSQQPSKAPAEKKAPIPEPAAKQPADKPAKDNSSGDDEVETAMVRALLDAVDEVEGEGDDVKKEMRRLLREADKELSQVLRGNSKRLIMKANQKPLAPVVGRPNSSGVKVREFRRSKPGATVPRR